MENSDDLEGVDSWEVIPGPCDQQQPSPSRQLGEEDEESAGFPPSQHEGLEVFSEETVGARLESEDGDLQDNPQPDSLFDATVWMGKQMRVGIGELSRRIVAAASFFWPCATKSLQSSQCSKGNAGELSSRQCWNSSPTANKMYIYLYIGLEKKGLLTSSYIQKVLILIYH